MGFTAFHFGLAQFDNAHIINQLHVRVSDIDNVLKWDDKFSSPVTGDDASSPINPPQQLCSRANRAQTSGVVGLRRKSEPIEECTNSWLIRRGSHRSRTPLQQRLQSPGRNFGDGDRTVGRTGSGKSHRDANRRHCGSLARAHDGWTGYAQGTSDTR